MSSSQATPILLPSSSTPSSPTPSYEDLSSSHIPEPSDDFEPVDTPSPPAIINKGKAKQYGGYIPGSQSQEALTSPIERDEHGSYPPISDEEAETRRVEETLRRWEIAERAKRKFARESMSQNVSTPASNGSDSISNRPHNERTRSTSEEPQSPSLPPMRTSASSFFAGVTRRASLLLSGKRPSVSSSTSSSTVPVPLSTMNPDAESVVPLQPIPSSPLESNMNSRRNSEEGMSSGASNPFVDPFVDGTEESSSLATPNAISYTTPITTKGAAPGPAAESPERTTTEKEGNGEEETEDNEATPTKKAKNRASKAPFPEPLGLPPPRTPPPIDRTPQMVPDSSRQMNRNGPQLQQEEEDEKDVKWWHEWLCGCGEGKERGGDYQAGRTNPFE